MAEQPPGLSPSDALWQSDLAPKFPAFLVPGQPTDPQLLTPLLVFVDTGWADPVRFPPFTVVEPGNKQIGINAFVTLKAALVAVAPHGVIQIAPGTYAGGLQIDRPVRLVGDCGSGHRPGPGAQAPVIDCSRSANGQGIVLAEGVSEVTIEGLRFTSQAGCRCTGLCSRGSKGVHIRHSSFAGLARGIDLDGAAAPLWLIENNLFTGEPVPPAEGDGSPSESTAIHLGADLTGQTPVVIHANDIERCSHAVRVLGQAPVSLIGNRLAQLTRAVLAIARNVNEWGVELDGNDIDPADGRMIEYLDPAN